MKVYQLQAVVFLRGSLLTITVQRAHDTTAVNEILGIAVQRA